MNIPNTIDIDFESLDDLPLSEHIEWNNYQSKESNLDELNFEQQDEARYIGNENLDFDSD